MRLLAVALLSSVLAAGGTVVTDPLSGILQFGGAGLGAAILWVLLREERKRNDTLEAKVLDLLERTLPVIADNTSALNRTLSVAESVPPPSSLTNPKTDVLVDRLDSLLKELGK